MPLTSAVRGSVAWDGASRDEGKEGVHDKSVPPLTQKYTHANTPTHHIHTHAGESECETKRQKFDLQKGAEFIVRFGDV